MDALDLKSRVMNHLNWDARVDASGIEVEIKDAVVILTGTVSSLAQHQAARNAALGVRGVAGVDNRIEIRYPPREPSLEDTARNVVAALHFDRNIDASTINVSAREGVVTLSGSVDELWKKRRALKAASNVRGVTRVINRLVVAPDELLDDDRISTSVKGALRRVVDKEADDIAVSVEAGVITLDGDIESPEAVMGAQLTAENARGAVEVRNRIVAAGSGAKSGPGRRRKKTKEPAVDEVSI